MDRPAVTVIVPVRNGADVLGPCLDALARQRRVDALEVIVVDNASSDRTASLAAAHRVVDSVVREPREGSYRARNAGIAAAKSRVLAFTDADCRPAPGWVAAGIDALDGADLAGGPVVAQPSSSPTVWERYDRATYLDQQASIEREGYAATSNLFVRVEVVDRVGPFDGRLPSSGDLEFCRRALAAGFQLAYAPEAVVHHLPRRTSVDTWHLHRRLGAGWAHLARLGQRPPMWRDRAHWLPLGWAVDRVAADGSPLRRRHLVAVHTTAMLARAVGRLTAR